MQRQHSSQATSTLGNTPNLNIGFLHQKENPTNALLLIPTVMTQPCKKKQQQQWRSQPKNLGGVKKFWAAKMSDFRRITLFCLEKRLSKYKMTICSKNWGGIAPLAPLATPMSNNTYSFATTSTELNKILQCTVLESFWWSFEAMTKWPS